jgi:hypothetical protein
MAGSSTAWRLAEYRSTTNARAEAALINVIRVQ